MAAVLGTGSADCWSPDIDTPANKRFIADFHAKYGQVPSNYVAAADDAIPYLKAAVEQAGGDIAATDAVRAALAKADYDSVRGRYKLGRNRFPIDRYRSLEGAAEVSCAWSLRSDGPQMHGLADPYVDDYRNPD
nr:ABC transporter substrate-binding protein [Agrobacterium sp. DSM 25558]